MDTLTKSIIRSMMSAKLRAQVTEFAESHALLLSRRSRTPADHSPGGSRGCTVVVKFGRSCDMAHHDKFDCRDCGPHIIRIVALPEGHPWCDRCTACNQRLASRRRPARHCRFRLCGRRGVTDGPTAEPWSSEPIALAGATGATSEANFHSVPAARPTTCVAGPACKPSIDICRCRFTIGQ
jgi:hypothetical protein